MSDSLPYGKETPITPGCWVRWKDSEDHPPWLIFPDPDELSSYIIVNGWPDAPTTDDYFWTRGEDMEVIAQPTRATEVLIRLGHFDPFIKALIQKFDDLPF